MSGSWSHVTFADGANIRVPFLTDLVVHILAIDLHHTLVLVLAATASALGHVSSDELMESKLLADLVTQFTGIIAALLSGDTLALHAVSLGPFIALFHVGSVGVLAVALLTEDALVAVPHHVDGAQAGRLAWLLHGQIVVAGLCHGASVLAATPPFTAVSAVLVLALLIVHVEAEHAMHAFSNLAGMVRVVSDLIGAFVDYSVVHTWTADGRNDAFTLVSDVSIFAYAARFAVGHVHALAAVLVGGAHGALLQAVAVCLFFIDTAH